MTILVQGILLTPFGDPAVGVEIRVIAQTSETSAETVGDIYITDSEGAYEFSLLNNTYILYIKADDTYEPMQNECIVDESTPSPITIPELIKYTTPIVIPEITNPDPDWDDLYSDIQTDVQTETQQDLEQIRDGDVYSAEAKQIWINDASTGKMANQTNVISTGPSNVTLSPKVYSDDSQNQSAEYNIDLEIDNITGSKEFDIRSTGEGEHTAVDKTNLTTPTGSISKEKTLSNLLAVDSEAVTLNGNGTSKNVEITETSTVSTDAVIHAYEDYSVTQTDETSIEYGYREEDTQVDIPDVPRVIKTSSINLEGGVNTADLFTTLLARIDAQDQIIVELKNSINVNNKVNSIVQTNNGLSTGTVVTVDNYTIQLNEETTPTLEVDTVNNTVNINGVLNIENADDFKGETGSTIFQVYQYSVTNSTDSWHEDYVSGDIYRRHNTSTDDYIDPLTWSEGYQLFAVDGADGDTEYIAYMYSADNIDWHEIFTDGDIWRIERIIVNDIPTTEWSDPARIKGTDGEVGDSVIIEYQYSVDGFEPWHSNFITGDHFRRERFITNGVEGEWSDAALIVPRVGYEVFDGESGSHGSGSYVIIVEGPDNVPDTSAGIDLQFEVVAGRPAQAEDIVTYNGSDEEFSESYLRGEDTWVAFTLQVDGDAIINGTLAAEALKAGTVTADLIIGEKITAGSGDNVAVLDGVHATYRFYAGNVDPILAPYAVTQAGVVYMSEGYVQGDLTIGINYEEANYVKFLGSNQSGSSERFLSMYSVAVERVRWDYNGRLRMYNEDAEAVVDFDPETGTFDFKGTISAENIEGDVVGVKFYDLPHYNYAVGNGTYLFATINVLTSSARNRIGLIEFPDRMYFYGDSGTNSNLMFAQWRVSVGGVNVWASEIFTWNSKTGSVAVNDLVPFFDVGTEATTILFTLTFTDDEGHWRTVYLGTDRILFTITQESTELG